MTDPYVILLNGPPRVGKDTIADMLVDRLRHSTKMAVIRETFKQPMMEAGLAIYGIDPVEYDDRKDLPHPEWGLSLREWMIDFSERFMKPRFGKGVWGKVARTRIQTWGKEPMVVVFTDLGFEDEYHEILEGTRPERVATVHFSRSGIGWGNDSRRYVPPAEMAHLIELPNNGRPAETAADLWAMLYRVFGHDWLDREHRLFA